MAIVRSHERQGELLPRLGLFTTTALIVGSMIGSGIFRLPASMMAKVQDPFVLILVWVVGGFFTICGALTFAEMAGMFPKAGGQYVFLRESMGKKWSFMYGWSTFWLIQSGIIAGVAVVFAEFNQRLFGFGSQWVTPIAIACIAFLSLINYLGVQFGGIVNNLFTVAKFGALAALVVLGFVLGDPEHATFDQVVPDAPVGWALFVPFVLAMLQGFFALDGWPQAAYVAPEVKNPTRNVPRAMFLGVASVVTIYVLATVVYVYLVPVSEFIAIAGSDGARLIAADAAAVFSGDAGARLISAAVIVSTFGTVNAYILTSPRIFYGLAQDRLFWHPFGKLHPQRNTPHMGILYTGIWSSYIVLLAGAAEDAYTVIVEAVVFGIWLFYIPTTIGYFRLRFKAPQRERPYKTLFYPVVPALFMLAAVVVVGTLLVSNTYSLFTGEDFLGDEAPIPGLAGLWGTILVLTGTPFLLVWWLRERRGEDTPVAGGPTAFEA